MLTNQIASFYLLYTASSALDICTSRSTYYLLVNKETLTILLVVDEMDFLVYIFSTLHVTKLFCLNATPLFGSTPYFDVQLMSFSLRYSLLKWRRVISVLVIGCLVMRLVQPSIISIK